MRGLQAVQASSPRAPCRRGCKYVRSVLPSGTLLWELQMEKTHVLSLPQPLQYITHPANISTHRIHRAHRSCVLSRILSINSLSKRLSPHLPYQSSMGPSGPQLLSPSITYLSPIHHHPGTHPSIKWILAELLGYLRCCIQYAGHRG